MKQPRKNKSKNEIVSDMQLVQDATRRRALVKEIIFPYLFKVDESIAYSKLLIQSYSGLIEGVYDDNRKRTTVGHLEERINAKLKQVFDLKDETQKKEYGRYVELTTLLKDISIQDFAYAAELPRFVDGFLMSDIGKKSIKDIDVDKILG